MMIWVWFIETEMPKFTHTWDIFYLHFAHTCSNYTVIFVLGKIFDKKKKENINYFHIFLDIGLGLS